MLDGITQAADRLERYDVEVARAMPGWRWEPVVRALMALRGFALLHAATLIAELGDCNSRFQSARPVDELSGPGSQRELHGR